MSLSSFMLHFCKSYTAKITCPPRVGRNLHKYDHQLGIELGHAQIYEKIVHFIFNSSVDTILNISPKQWIIGLILIIRTRL